MPITLTRNRTSNSLDERINKGMFESFILIVPTKRRCRHLTRELLASKAVPLPELPLFTLEMLSKKIIQAVFEKARVVDEPVLTLLLNQAIGSSRDDLRYFNLRGRNAQLPRGTLQKIMQIVRKLKEVGVYPAALDQEVAMGEEDEQPKLRDIVTIYQAYEKALASLDGLDSEGVLKALHLECTPSQFERAFRGIFPGVEEVSIVGFDEFTEPELSFIQKICSMNLTISLVFDFQPGNPSLFGHLEENYRRFRELGFVPDDESGARKTPSISYAGVTKTGSPVPHIARALFDRKQKERLNCTQEITVAKTKDRIREVELICRLIKRLAAGGSYPDLSRICVAMYRPQTYTHIFREQCAKFGIPVNITDRFELSQAPPVVSIIGLLEVAMRGFRRDDVLRALGSSYFEFMNAGKPVDRANLATVSLELRIIAGVRTWLKKIGQQTKKIQEEILLSTEEENTRRTRDIGRLQKAADDIRWLDDTLREITPDHTPHEFQQRLQQLLERLELPRCIVSGGGLSLIEKDARAYGKFLDVVTQTAELLEYQEGKLKKHPLKFYVEQLKVAVSQERYNVREQFGAGVLVTSIEETRGLPVDVMIVAGLVDGEFPAVYQPEIFLSNKRMKEREQRHSWENRYLFYQAITNWSDHLYLTYPAQDADLDLVRSSFVDALKNIADVEEWEYPGNSPLDHVLYSEEDFLVHHGSSKGRGLADVFTVPPSLQSKTKYMERAIEVEQSRVNEHNLPEYEGIISRSISGEAWERLQQLRHRVYSVSQLETYGKCPYQFFAQRLLRLNALEDLEEEFSPLEKGSVLHETLFEFYTERREKGMPPVIGCSDEEFTEARRDLLSIAERKLAEIDCADAFWELEKELMLGDRQTGQGVLSEFLGCERGRTTPLRPQYFEVGFGQDLGQNTRIDKTFSSSEPVLAGQVQLRGKVDRVELGDEVFAIVDYKTGKELPRLDDIRNGISLQLPLYLFTMEKLLSEKKEKELDPAGGIYYQLRHPVAIKVGVGSDQHKRAFEVVRSNVNLLPSDNDLRNLIDESVKRVNTYVDEMMRGNFPLTTHDKIDKVCTYCDYKTICRIQSVRRVDKPIAEEE